MKKMLQNLRFVAVALGALLAVSCANEPEENVTKKFILPDVAEQYLPAEGVAEADAIVIPVFATDNDWMILQEEESMEWLHVTTVMDAEGSKALSVTAEANEALESRETYLNIYYDTYSTSILFVQVAADEQDATSIECDSMVVVTNGFGDVEFDVTANGAYEVVIPSDVDWLSWDNGKFFFGNYFGEQPRVAEVVVRSEFAEAKVTFVQVGSLEFSVAKTDYTLTYKAGTLRIPVQTWLDEACAATTTVDWLRADAEATTKDTIVLVYDENSTEEPRSATVELSAGSTKLTIDIDQIAPKEYDAIVSDKQKSDLILKVAKADASSQFSSSRGSMKNAYDGNDLSYWSTTATNQDGTVFISFEFAEDQEMTQIDYFRYCPSRSISWGNWGKVEVYTQFEGEEEKLFATYDFEMADTPRTVEFDEPLPVNIQKATFKIFFFWSLLEKNSPDAREFLTSSSKNIR